MINLPSELLKLQQGNDLRPLKPFAFLYRNKWNPEINKYQLETSPIDITPFVIKPNTLSMTLDVTEVAQYNANNITLTLTDINNRFVEGTPLSYFPEGYQIYGSQVVLYYGTSTTNMTSLFVGVIKDLPSYKPETYQVDLKLISPLELLSDIEAKEFSDKYFGETLTANGTDSSNNPIYKTAHTGVGGFNAVYADGIKIFEGIDYEVKQTNTLALPALITIINSEYNSSIITADYYCWKTGLSVEQIIEGLLALGGYTSDTEDIRNVVWTTEIKNPSIASPVFVGLGYYESAPNEYTFNWPSSNGAWANNNNVSFTRKNIIPHNFDYQFVLNGDRSTTFDDFVSSYAVGSEVKNGNNSYGIQNGVYIKIYGYISYIAMDIYVIENSAIKQTLVSKSTNSDFFRINVRNNSATLTTIYRRTGAQYVYNFTFTENQNFNITSQSIRGGHLYATEQVWNFYDDNLRLIGANIQKPCIITQVLDKNTAETWGAITAALTQGQGTPASYFLTAFFSDDGQNWGEGQAYNLGTDSGVTSRYLYYILGIDSAPNNYFHIKEPSTYYYATNLFLNIVNLSGKTVLEALQDFALISSYEFGVNRNGIFFFRPRMQSTTPIYTLDHTEVVKVDSIKKELSDFFTKLTLTFAERPLEFYANTGNRPTPIDKYGVINKEIDKPEIINYDNTELAQAIGPQLLNIYSHLSNQLQVTSKLNLALELGDIVNLKRSYPQVVNSEASEQHKYEKQQTYYRACKIIGLNYNFEKKQVSYTLEDVGDETNGPTD